MQKNKARSRFIVACVAPATILALIFLVIPTFNVFRMSLFKWGGYSANKTFVGLNNFVTLFQDENFFRSCRNSILLIVVVTLITITLALLFAYLLTREKLRGQNFFRIVFYVPNILSVVVISAIFSAIYDSNRGLLNNILSLFRGDADPIYWLGDQKPSSTVWLLPWCGRRSATIWLCIWHPCPPFPKVCMNVQIWRVPPGQGNSSPLRCR